MESTQTQAKLLGEQKGFEPRARGSARAEIEVGEGCDGAFLLTVCQLLCDMMVWLGSGSERTIAEKSRELF